jgi:tryptophan synthase alpha subunit
MQLFPIDHPFKLDYESGIKSYYSTCEKYKLFGVLIRDVEPDERDLSLSYNRLKTQILDPVGLSLLALYIPIQKKNWLSIINSMTE